MMTTLVGARRGADDPASPPRRSRKLGGRLPKFIGVVAGAAAILLVAAGPAAAATSTQVASGLTSPLGILQLPANDGQTHVWVSDHLNGVCRLDPSASTPGQLTLNQSTCVLFIGRSALKPGQLSYDSINQRIYAPDLAAKSVGVIRFGYEPSADSGRGGLSIFDRTVIVSNCGLDRDVPWASALGPDGDLYLAFKKSPSITRVRKPATVAGTSSNCAQDVQTIGNAADGKKAFQLAFLGHDLWEADNFALGLIPDAVAAARPAGTTINDGVTTRTFTTATPPVNATAQFVGSIPSPTAITADSARSLLYVGNANAVYTINLAPGGGTVALIATGFSFVGSISADAIATPPNLLVGDDTSNGTFPNAGRLWRITP
jgi:hypothetical protein